MAKGCLQMYIGKTCDEWEKFPNHCMLMLNEGQGHKTLANFMKAEDEDWLRNFANYFTPPNGIYSECVMANAIREAILSELNSRHHEK